MANELIPSQDQNSDASAPLQGGGAVPFPAGRLQAAMLGNRRLLLTVAGVLVVLGFTSLAFWSAEPPYRSIFTGMSGKEAASVVDYLQKSHIPYRIEGAGMVMVPSDQVYMDRIKLAGQGLTPGSGRGFELFDKKMPFGISDFVQKVNLQRALQAELARTIEVLSQVRAARVQLVLAKDSAFADRQRHASASVMLQLVGGRSLAANTILAIQNLVAAGIPDLKPGAVTIVDSSGNLLTMKKRNGVAGGRSMMDNQARFERRLEARLTSMLEKVVGVGQAVVRVSADMTHDAVEQNSKRYNPDEAVLLNQKTITENKSFPGGLAGGVAGMASNRPPSAAKTALPSTGSATARSPMRKASRNERTSNYEISSTTERRIIPPGIIKKLSVAVIVGGSFKEGKDGQTFIPRDKKDIKAIRNLVERAIGYNEDRGDSIEVQSMPLVEISDHRDATALAATEKRSFYLNMARYGVAGLALLLLVWFVLRPVSKWLGSGPGSKRDTSDALRGIEDAMPESAAIPASSVEHIELQRSARDLAIEDPAATAMIIRQWMRES